MAQAALAIPESAPTLGVPHARIGLSAFLATQALLFAALLTACLWYRTRGVADPGLELSAPSVGAFVLLMGSVAWVVAVDGYRHERAGRGRIWLAVALALGATFLAVQTIAMVGLLRAEAPGAQSPFTSSLAVLSGLHAAHVVAGLTWLGAILVHQLGRSGRGAAPAHLELCGLYWHFVGIVWTLVFPLVHLARSPARGF